jgi:RNA polymerase sigma-70 factor (ECF subfamily)
LAEGKFEIHGELIEECKLGNTKAQYQLYRLYSKAMYNVSYRVTGNANDAEDILQEAFTEAFLKLDTYRYESSFGAWLKRIVINKSINLLKKKKASLLFTDGVEEYEYVNDENVDWEDINFNVSSIMEAHAKLPEGYRLVFSLYLLEGYDHAEISSILNISESTSKSQLLRAKQKLKELLKNKI